MLRIMSKKVLNIDKAVPVLQDDSSWEPIQLAVKLQKDMLKIKGEYMSEDGKSVDYVKLKNSDTFKDYVKQSCQLHHLDLTKLSVTERKAFFISILCVIIFVHNGCVIYTLRTHTPHYMHTDYACAHACTLHAHTPHILHTCTQTIRTHMHAQESMEYG